MTAALNPAPNNGLRQPVAFATVESKRAGAIASYNIYPRTASD